MGATGPEFVGPADAQPPAVAPAPAPARELFLPTAPGRPGRNQAPLEPFGHGTLGRRLVVQVTVLVALVAVLLSTFTALAARTLLLGSIDQQLDGVSVRALRGDPGGQRGPRDQLLIPGQPPGTLAAAVASNGSGGWARSSAPTASSTPMPPVSLDAIAGLDVDQGKQTVTLPGLGRYRSWSRKVKVIKRRRGHGGPGVLGDPAGGWWTTSSPSSSASRRCSPAWPSAAPWSPPGPSSGGACVR